MRAIRQIFKNETLWVVLIYFSLTWIICFRFLIGDYLPLPFDNYSLINKEKLNEDLWTVKNQLVSDSSFQMYPWKKLIYENYRKREIPTFNPYIILGNSLVGNGQSAPFYPGNLLFIFGFNVGWKILFFSQFFLAAFFMFLFLKANRFLFSSAFLGGLIYGYSGFMAAWDSWTTVGHTVLWLPLMFLAIYKWGVALKLRWLALLIFSIFCSITAGFPQFSLYSLGAAFAYFLFLAFERKHLKKQYWVFGSLAFVWGIGITSLQILPIQSLLSISNRISQFKLHNFSGMPFEYLFTMLIPGFFGWPNDTFYFGAINFNETANYFGIIPLGFVLITLVGSYRKYFFWKILFLTCLILAFDNFISQRLSEMHALIFGRGLSGRLFIISTFSGAVLAAKGMEQFANENRLRSSVGVILLTITSFLLLIKFVSTFRYLLLPQSNFIYQLEFIGQETTFPLIFLSIALVFWFLARIIKRNWILFGLLLLITVDLFSVINKVTPWSKDSLLNEPEVLNVKKQLSDPVGKTIGFISTGENILFGAPGFEGYDSIYPKSYLAFLEKNCRTATSNFTNWVYVDEVDCLQVVEKIGLKYLIDKDNLLFSQMISRWGKQKITNEFELKNSFGNESIYEFKKYKPPVLFSREEGVINNFSGGPNKFDIKVNSRIPQEITIYMNFLDGWNAKVNNQTAASWASNDGFINMNVSKGDSEIRLEYFPQSLINGIIISAGFLLSGFVFLLLKRKEF